MQEFKKDCTNELGPRQFGDIIGVLQIITVAFYRLVQVKINDCTAGLDNSSSKVRAPRSGMKQGKSYYDYLRIP